MRHDGRANPCQLVIGAATWESLARLRDDLVAAHEASFGKGAANDLVVGLQLTHSGRYARPSAWDRAGAARRLRPPGPRPALPRRRADPDRRGPRPPGRRLRAGRRPRAAGRLPVRGREALPRLPGPRAPRRARPARPLRRQPREPHPLPAHGRRGHPRRGPGPARRRALLGLRHRALAEGRIGPGRARAGRRGLHARPSASSAASGMDDALAESRALLRLLQGLGIRWVCVSAGQPLLQPARAAARALPAERRLPAARGPARGRRPPGRAPRRS